MIKNGGNLFIFVIVVTTFNEPSENCASYASNTLENSVVFSVTPGYTDRVTINNAIIKYTSITTLMLKVVK